VTLADLNALSADHAEAEFRRCCGSTRWATAMAAARPFATVPALLGEADRVGSSLGRPDWLEAFAAHPRLGEPATSAWSAEEQAGASSAAAQVREALARGNEAYEHRFGYIFLVCATGKSAAEMLDILDKRLRNAPDDELRVAADEQRRITKLRLQKLVTG
jgi:2-oxo-4-hydroxy-4-carboxy-5-ureidoimidazoline decarboxylase